MASAPQLIDQTEVFIIKRGYPLFFSSVLLLNFPSTIFKSGANSLCHHDLIAKMLIERFLVQSESLSSAGSKGQPNALPSDGRLSRFLHHCPESSDTAI